jgi:hypothetical protein
MAHEILGQRFLGRSKPAWHELGTVFPEEMEISASEAVEKVAGDIKIEVRPLKYTIFDGSRECPYDSGHRAVVRLATNDDPEPRVFGVVSGDWVHADYVSLARRLDALSKEYKVETAGLLKQGSLCFLSMRGVGFDVAGDEMQDYYIVNLSNQPGVAHRVMAAPVRVVCNNTNTLAISYASINLSIPHSDLAEDRIAFAAELVSRFRSITAESRSIFEQFARTQITNDNLDLILAAAWPDPPMPKEVKLFAGVEGTKDEQIVQAAMGNRFGAMLKSKDAWQRDTNRAHALRNAGIERFEAFDPANLRGTVWAAYNAVTEIADWRESFGNEVGASVLFGNRAQEKANAFKAAMKVVA